MDLSSICHGSLKKQRNQKIYSYKPTLNEFLKRYDDKSKDTKAGMIGELLTHIVIPTIFPNLKVASPLFNLEETSVKKGFDIIYFDEKIHTWLTEVKSTNSQMSDITKISKGLLGLGYRDLKKRALKKNQTIWHNAVNSATSALIQNDTKDAFLKILDDYLNNSTSINVKNDLNIIISGVIFNKIKNNINIDKVSLRRGKYENEKKFQAIVSITIKKKVFREIEKFLREESR
ncbi:hypothetical protein AB3N58_06905 [Leptospira sp. WS60.C2]